MPYEIPKACKQAIAECFEAVLPDARDAIGKIDTDTLTLLVMSRFNREHPELAAEMAKAAFGYAINAHVHYLIRNSKAPFVEHHRQAVDTERSFKRTAKERQRRIVSFRDHTGLVVFKDRMQLTKSELPLVANYYRRQEASAHDVVVWCEETYEQMNLLKLGDDAVVGDVLTEEAA